MLQRRTTRAVLQLDAITLAIVTNQLTSQASEGAEDLSMQASSARPGHLSIRVTFQAYL